MQQQAHVPDDATKVTRLLGACYGTAPTNTTLGSLRRRNPHLDRFDWLLLVIAIEIDLKVRLAPRLIEADRLTIAKFAKAVAVLPKVSTATHTLDMLTLLAQALLGDSEVRPTSRRRQPKRSPHRRSRS